MFDAAGSENENYLKMLAENNINSTENGDESAENIRDSAEKVRRDKFLSFMNV